MNRPTPRKSGYMRAEDKVAIVKYLDLPELENRDLEEQCILNDFSMSKEELDEYRQKVYANKRPFATKR